MFKGRARQNNSGRRRSPHLDDGQASFDMAAYRRGVAMTNRGNPSGDQKTERQKLHSLRIIRRRLMIILTIVVALTCLGFVVLSQFTNRISKVVSTGQAVKLSSSNVQKYKKIADEYFAKNSSERLSFIRRDEAFTAFMIERAPEIKSISIQSLGFGNSELAVELRQPVAMWSVGSETKYVDNRGKVFAENYFDQPQVSIQDNSGVKINGGGAATSVKFLSFVGKTVVELQNKHQLKVEKVVIPQGSIRYVEFYLAGRPYPFKAQITRDSLSQAADIAVMARYVDNKKIKPQYIDNRIEGRAYWK